ncbi:glycoside hydrolase family 127 protein [Symbioplanes lichenis]|uniref:glycoside hydrolase family 127 protein n=1 Tax=Symbioplanes lichenis TaxID=1629072 RepID=UPI00273904B0|nr:glycoside hydrolase family 127 protein [Actinoplanes lichenis]
MKRRTVLGAGAAVPIALAAAAPASGSPSVRSGNVRLLDSRYRQNMMRTVAYLRFVDLDRMLHMFRVTAGRPSTALALGGWEAPDVQLRGHTTGHLLSGLAQAAYHLDDAELRARSATLVAGLAECQAPDGYLSAFPASVFDDLEAGKNPWAPYYTIHKILAGLLDQHRLLGSSQALRVALGIARWADARTSALTREQMQKVLHVEFGGMNEALFNLFAVTRDPAHLELAQRFDHDEIFVPLSERRDTLAGRHANTDIAKIVGAAAAWQITGSPRYETIASYFWDQVVGHHTYVIGGNANAEFFGPPDQIVSQLGENTCENCNSYNMLKLTLRLLAQRPERVDYLDYYEWTLLNQMLGEQDPDSAHGNVTYYTGLSQGTQRKGKDGLVSDPGSYSSDYGNFSCDHGSGLETHTKFAEPIYAQRGDELTVQLFIPSEISFRGSLLRLTTGYPYSDTIRITVTEGGSFALRIRIPGWVSGPTLRVAGAPVHVRPGTYASIRRRWRTGDVVELTLPMRPRWLAAPDNPAIRALTYGPLVLAGRHGDNPPAVVPTVDPALLRREPGRAEFSLGDLRLSPFLDVHHEHYSVYFALPPVRRRGVVAAYPLTGSLRDRTRRWDDAVLAGGAVAGERGIELDGKGAHVALPAGLPANLTELTISVAVRLNSIANSARVFDLGFNTQSYMFLTPRTGNGTARFALKLGGMDGEDYVDAAVALPVGTWTTVKIVVGKTLQFYVDDVLSGENKSPRMGALLLGATHFNYLGRSQNPKHPYLDAAVADFMLSS